MIKPLVLINEALRPREVLRWPEITLQIRSSLWISYPLISSWARPGGQAGELKLADVHDANGVSDEHLGQGPGETWWAWLPGAPF